MSKQGGWAAAGRMAALALAASAGALLVLAVPSVRAEDPCPPDAPRHAAAVQGHTWTGTVVSAEPIGEPTFGVEPWAITFDVDHVYADRPEPDVPTPPIVVGQPFELPSNTCGRPGDMGFRPGHHYLVSTSSFGDGTAIGSIVAWEIDGERVTLVPGMYGSMAMGAPFAGIETLDRALALVAPGAPTDDDGPSAGWEGSVAVVLVAAAALAGGIFLLVRRRARYEGR